MIAKPSRTRKTRLQGRVPDQYRRFINWWLNTLLVVLIALPLTVMAIYCANLPNGGLMAFGAAVMVAAASTLAGGLLGFLFGIPNPSA